MTLNQIPPSRQYINENSDSDSDSDTSQVKAKPPVYDPTKGIGKFCISAVEDLVDALEEDKSFLEQRRRLATLLDVTTAYLNSVRISHSFTFTI